MSEQGCPKCGADRKPTEAWREWLAEFELELQAAMQRNRDRAREGV